MRCNIPIVQGQGLCPEAAPDTAGARSDNLMMQAALAASPDGVVLVDSDGIILLANASMASMSGYSAEELRGQSVSIFLPPPLREKHGQQMRGYFLQPAKRTMGSGQDLWLSRPDGSTVPVDSALG